jgi:hypothetical protein
MTEVALGTYECDGLHAAQESKLSMLSKDSNRTVVAAKDLVEQPQLHVTVLIDTINVKAPRRSRNTRDPFEDLFNANNTETDNVWLLEEREHFGRRGVEGPMARKGLRQADMVVQLLRHGASDPLGTVVRLAQRRLEIVNVG